MAKTDKSPDGLIHSGNNNYKRRKTTCGLPASWNDSTDVKKVNCIKCVELLVYRGSSAQGRTAKTPKWELRLIELRNPEIRTPSEAELKANDSLGSITYVRIGPQLTAVTNMPDVITFTKKEIEDYIKLRKEFDSKTQEEHHKEALERWNGTV
jgi:hypothetical protein